MSVGDNMQSVDYVVSDICWVAFEMEISDELLLDNRDWDPSYLSEVLSVDFFEFEDLWDSNVNNCDLVSEVNKMEMYQPVVEDISLDDDTLCEAVELIEKVYVVVISSYILF